MAISVMEKLKLTFQEEELDRVLDLMQGFQGIHIETGIESTIPPAKKAGIDKEIREIERVLEKIRAAAGILKERKTAKLSGLFADSGEKHYSISELVKIVEESDWEKILDEIIQTDRRLQDNRLRRQEVTDLLESMEIWEHLKYNPLDFSKLRMITTCFGSVHKKHAEEFSDYLNFLEEDGISFEEVTEYNDRVYFLLLCHNSMCEKLNSYMNEFSFSPEKYPFEKSQGEIKKELEAEELRLLEDEKEINKLLSLQAKYEEIMLFAEDYNLNILLRKKKSLEITYDEKEIIINGWIEAARSRQFERLLAERMPHNDYQLLLSPVREKDINEVPIRLQNNKLVTVYERLTEMYSLPRYNEIDPTPVLTVFYFIFFGMMVADVGYGLAVFLIGLLIRKVLKVKRSTKGFFDFLFYLSFPIMGWGFIYGSFCGMPLPFGLISATVDIIPMAIIAIGLGYLHIMAGLVLHMINKIRLKNYFDMLTGGLSWFLTFLGGGVMLITSLVPWLSSEAVFITAAVVCGLGLVMTILVPAIQYGKRWYAGFGKGLYTLYGATSYLGDFISYARLMALGVAGGSIAMAFNTILGFMPLIVRFSLGIVLAVVLHGLNMFLTMLSAYVHGIRLQFIEFFGKFYTGGGRRFEPFKAAEKNIIISDSSDVS